MHGVWKSQKKSHSLVIFKQCGCVDFWRENSNIWENRKKWFIGNKYWKTVGFKTNGLPHDFFVLCKNVANIGKFLLPFSWSEFRFSHGYIWFPKTATFCNLLLKFLRIERRMEQKVDKKTSRDNQHHKFPVAIRNQM